MTNHLNSNRTRNRARGAIFVEAILIVSVLTFLFVGLVFFRTMYLKQMRTARLARASIMAYSMGGCDEPGGPGAWAPQDISGSTTQTGGVDKTQEPAKGVDVPADSGEGAMLKTIGGVPSNGSALFPLASMSLQTQAGASTRDSPLGARRGLKRTVRATSYVICGEEMRDGELTDLLHAALSFLKI